MRNLIVLVSIAIGFMFGRSIESNVDIAIVVILALVAIAIIARKGQHA